MNAAIEPIGGAATPEPPEVFPGVTKRIARITKRLFKHHLSFDAPLFPSGIPRATACAWISGKEVT